MITTTLCDVGRPALSEDEAVVFVLCGDLTGRELLELLIHTAGWQPEAFASAREFLAHPPASLPSCLILDVTMSDIDGLELQRRLAAERSDMPVIFITGRGDVFTSVEAMKAGAIDCLAKPFADDVLLGAIRDALVRSRRALAREARMTTLRERCASLTRREREVMVLVVSGLLNKQVAGELGISEITVKAHRGQVMRKMNAGSLPALVNMAAMLGLGVPAA